MPIKNYFKLVYGESKKKEGWTWYALDVYQEDKRVIRIFLRNINEYLIIKNILNNEVE